MATYYDPKLSKDYANKWLHNTPRRLAIYHTWKEACGDVSGLKVADLACGSGTTSRMLAEKNAEVVGIDLSEHQLKYAIEEEQRQPMGIKYYQADLRDSSTLPNVGNFDLVTPTFLFNYAHDSKELKNMAESCAKLLRSGGKISAITINPFHPTETLVEGEGSKVEWVDKDKANTEGAELRVQLYDENKNPITPFVTHFYSSKTYESILGEVGFSEVEWVHLKIPDSVKTSFPRWKELEDNVSVVVFTAIKK